MFQKENRLLKSEDFGYVFKKPLKVYGESFDLYVRPNKLSLARLGLAVPKKAIKHAVMRNRIKRVFREYFRAEQSCLQGFDVVVVVKKNMGTIESHDQAGVVDAHWRHMLGRLKP